MTINSEEMIKSIIESLEKIEYIKPQEIPNIDLYMDQVTTFMDEKLRSVIKNPNEEKILTKTMINNYAKNDLLPPPIKKKYSKEHVLLLIFIYYYKGILSISDIQSLLGPITEKYFRNDSDFSLEDIYNEVFSMEKEQVESLKKDVYEKYHQAEQTFDGVPDEEQEFLKTFSFICLLSFDVYVKKLIIERLVDELGEKPQKETKEQKGAKEQKGTKS